MSHTGFSHHSGCLLILDNRAKAEERRQSFPGRKTILSCPPLLPPKKPCFSLKNAASPIDQASCCGAIGGTKQQQAVAKRTDKVEKASFEHCGVSPHPPPTSSTSSFLPGKALPFTRRQRHNKTALGATAEHCSFAPAQEGSDTGTRSPFPPI